MALAVYIFPDTYLRVVTITFTALILSEILNVYTEVIIFLLASSSIIFLVTQGAIRNRCRISWNSCSVFLEYYLLQDIY